MENHIDKQKRVSGEHVLAHLHEHVASSGGRGKVVRLNLKPLAAAVLAASMLAACGGGGGDGGATAQPDTSNPGSQTGGSQTGGGTQPGGTTEPGGTTQPGGTTDPGGTTQPGGGTQPGGNTQPGTAALPAPVPSTASMAMSCVDGAGFQCSGSSIIRTDNGVALTSSGVQVFGKSTSDLAATNPDKTNAFGFALDTEGRGLAEVRVQKDSNGVITTPALLLSNLGLSWDGKVERPTIIETFRPTYTRVGLNTNGTLNLALTLPEPSVLSFYDFATLGPNGTQANYANNSYFPRTVPIRCPGAEATPPQACPPYEPPRYTNTAGNWRAPANGAVPDEFSTGRKHEDGDVHAGNSTTGGPLPGGTGVGVPFPGAKGYRDFTNWGLRYANVNAWTSQDTVLIAEWTGIGANEHNKKRRGIVSYGEVTPVADVPTTGTATYVGTAYGWYSTASTQDPPTFRGPVTVTVNFATRQAVVSVQNTIRWDGSEATIPATFSAATGFGAVNTNVTNYLNGPITSGTVTGGVSGRFYGPVVSTGTSGAGPAEIGGAFRMSDTAGVAIIGGFIGRKQ